MSSIIFYCLQLVLCSAILFAYYLVALKNKRFHQFNRFYLLSIPVVSALIPLLRIEVFRQADTGTPSPPIRFFEVVADNNTHLEDYVMQTAAAPDRAEPLLLAYMLVSLVIFIGLAFSIGRIFLLLRNSACKKLDGGWLVSSGARGTPFSFFCFVFWNDAIDISGKVGQQVLRHEMAHVKQKHSIDKLALALLLCFAWFNPVFWLLRKELNMVHEFIADQAAVDKDASGLAEMLLSACFPAVNFGIASSFFHSPIKRRLAMIMHLNHTRFNRLRRLMIVPILSLVVMLFAFRTQMATIVGMEPAGNFVPVPENCDPGVLSKVALKTKLEPKPVIGKTGVKLNRVYRVVLDAGHGGHDGGARAEDGTQESQLVLELVKTILEENANEHIKLILTRATDEYQHPFVKSELSKKNKADLFVSIHAAADDNPENNGIELFVPTKDSLPHYKASYSLANNLANKLAGLDENVQIKQRKVGIWVVNASVCPAVLIEAGFLTNKKDLEKLKNKDYQRKLARAILRGIETYLLEPGC